MIELHTHKLCPGLLVAVVIGASLSGCAAAPEPGEVVHLELIDDEFVRVDGERIAMTEFIYRMRVRCRAAKSAGEPPPVVMIRQSTADPRVGRDIMDQLALAGVKDATYGT